MRHSPARSVEIEQVLINLLMNAIDAMREVPPAERYLFVTVDRAGPHQVRVAVGDRGVGLDGTDPSRLFDAFYTTKEGGTGIGLSMSRTIVEYYAGRIWPSRIRGAVRCLPSPCRAVSRATRPNGRQRRRPRVWLIARSIAHPMPPSETRNEPEVDRIRDR